MNGLVGGCGQRLDGYMDTRIDEWIHIWMSGWINGWMDCTAADVWIFVFAVDTVCDAIADEEVAETLRPRSCSALDGVRWTATCCNRHPRMKTKMALHQFL